MCGILVHLDWFAEIIRAAVCILFKCLWTSTLLLHCYTLTWEYFNSHRMCWTRGQIRWGCFCIWIPGNYTVKVTTHFFQPLILLSICKSDWVDEISWRVEHHYIYIYIVYSLCFFSGQAAFVLKPTCWFFVGSCSCSGTLTFPSDAPEWTEQELELFVGSALRALTVSDDLSTSDVWCILDWSIFV